MSVKLQLALDFLELDVALGLLDKVHPFAETSSRLELPA